VLLIELAFSPRREFGSFFFLPGKEVNYGFLPLGPQKKFPPLFFPQNFFSELGELFLGLPTTKTTLFKRVLFFFFWGD